MKKHSSSTKKYYSVLIGAALLAASLFQFSRPAFSAGTAAGTTIRNTATGSYEDDAGKEYTTESNTIDVTIARVAGITNVPLDIENQTNPGGRILTGNRLSFDFEITNVGNDASDIFIPGVGNIITSGLIDVANGDNENNLVIQVSPPLDANGNVNQAGNPSNGNPFVFGAIPDGTDPIPQSRDANGTVPDVAANGKVLVRVTSTVTATGQGSAIDVRLGNTGTPANDGSIDPDTQNQPDDDGEAGGELDDVRTAGQTTDTGNTLVGPEKEASSLNRTVLGANPLAMVYIGKVRGVRVPNTNSLQDDVIPYSLNLEVRGNSESSIFTPGDLEGRDFSSTNTDTGEITGTAINSNNSNLILVSDAIPQFTDLADVPTGADIPTNWTPVYTTDALTVLPTDADWTSDAPGTPGGAASLTAVTRIGWVYDAGANGAIPAGTTNIDSFTFRVVTIDLPSDGGTVANIAQAFGTTDDGAAGITGTQIFDESGDQDSSNFTGETRGPDENDPLSTGVADPATHGEDGNNDNTGDPADPGGEDNVLTIGVPGQLINGPRDEADATGNIFGIGPNNQHDFQNLGVNADENNNPVTAKPGEDFNPAPITFDNTFTYPSSTGAAPLTDVKLQPIRPDFGTIGGDNDFIPIDTIVEIAYNGQFARYIYRVPAAGNTNGEARFEFVGPGTGTATGPVPNGTGNDAIEFPTLAPGSEIDYQVIVNLPAGTDFSTNINRGFPIPIAAFTDNDAAQDGVPDIDSNGFIVDANITVNQIYTGFVKIVKQLRVLDSDGDVRGGMNYSNDDADKEPRPGDTLEYRVIYRNISEPQAGNNSNVILNGTDVRIDENGTADIADGVLDASGNNWALDNDDNETLDTLHVPGEARNSNLNSTINYYSGSSTDGGNDPSFADTGLTDLGNTEPQNTDEVTGYRTTIPDLPPAGAEAVVANPWDETVNTGDFVFTFQRQVEGFELPPSQTQTQTQTQPQSLS